MFNRLWLPFVAVGIVSLLLIGNARAADPQVRKGIVLSAGEGRLSIKDTMGNQHSYTADAATKITVNGKPGKLEDLQEGVGIQVMTDDKGTLLSVSTIDKDKGFVFYHSPTHHSQQHGRVVSGEWLRHNGAGR
jgi:hypothetical protein